MRLKLCQLLPAAVLGQRISKYWLDKFIVKLFHQDLSII